MSIEERLQILERELLAEKRRNRWLLVVVGLGVMSVALAWTLANTTTTAQAQGANIGPKVIRANKFILEDETGKIRAALSVNKDGPTLKMLDENGKIRTELGAGKDGVSMTLADENGKPRIGLLAVNDISMLKLLDENGTGRLLLGVATGATALSVNMCETRTPPEFTVAEGGERVRGHE